MKTALLSLLLTGPAAVWAAPPAVRPAPSAPPAAVSPKPAPAVSVQSIYNAERLRDPFRSLTAGTLAAGHKFNLEDFSIHNLTLRGIMGDRRSGFAVFTDNTYGYTLMLRRGRLYAPGGKPVPGVGGRLDLRRKRASLQTREGDVQIFRLGERETD